MIRAIVVLLVLALGELDSTSAGADNYADVLTFGSGEGLKIDPGVFGGFIGGEEGHRHRALHAVFVFL